MLEQKVGCTLDKHLNDPLRTPLLYFQLETLFTFDFRSDHFANHDTMS